MTDRHIDPLTLATPTFPAEAVMAMADLLKYPEAEFESTAKTAVCHLRSACHATDGSALQRIVLFENAMSSLSAAEREELYTATFDITPVCVPYVSIHLFGEENFKRGEFMASLNARLAAIHFNTQGELPDHIAVLLGFAARAEEPERRESIEYCLLGPLEKMRGSLPKSNPYWNLLTAALELLQNAYPGMTPAPSPLEQRRQHGSGCVIAPAGCGCSAAHSRREPPASLERPLSTHEEHHA